MPGKNLVLELSARVLYAGTYLLKLQIDDVILGGHSQACPGMAKEAIKTLIFQKLKEV